MRIEASIDIKPSIKLRAKSLGFSGDRMISTLVSGEMTFGRPDRQPSGDLTIARTDQDILKQKKIL